MTRNRRATGALALGVLTATLLAGCEEKGPAQKVGEKIDKALEQLEGKGPVEKAGEKIDKAVGELKK